VPLNAKVLPAPTKFRVVTGLPLVIEVPAEEMPRLNPPVAVTIPEALILVALATPREGVTSVGEVAKTNAPLPVSSVTADAKLAEEGVAKKVATLAARPLIPVETGKPVQLVNVPDVGVPRAGVTNVGLVANTRAPVPVSPVTADAKLAEEGVAKKVATFAPRPVRDDRG